MASELLNKEENEVIVKTVELWDAFLKLENLHPSHNRDMEFFIHRIQDLIMSRPVMKEFREKYKVSND